MTSPQPATAAGDSIPICAIPREQRNLVLLEATMLEYMFDGRDDSGIEWRFTDRSDSFAYTVVENGAPAAVGYGRMYTLTQDERVEATDALAASQRSCVISAPTMLVVNNGSGTIIIGTSRQQVRTVWEADGLDGLKIVVTPRINEDSSVTLGVSLDCGDDTVTATGAMNNSLTVAEGRTLVIDSIRGKRRELLIFMTPRIVSHGEAEEMNRQSRRLHSTDDNQVPQDICDSVPATGDRLDLNRATLDQLRKVGFDDLTARVIISYRNRYGYYISAADLRNVPGMTAEVYDQLKDKVMAGGEGRPSGNLTQPRLTRAEAIRISEEAARSEGYDIQKYNIRDCRYELIGEDFTWFVFFDLKPPAPLGGGFAVVVDDRTKNANDLAETLARNPAFLNSGLSPQDALAICRLMVTIAPRIIPDAPHTSTWSSSDMAASDTRIISVEVEPGGDTVHIRTGEIRAPLAGRGELFTFVRKLGRWYKIEHSYWIS